MKLLFTMMVLSGCGFLFLSLLSLMMFFNYPFLMIDGKIATGYNKGITLLKAAICQLLIFLYCYHKIKKK